MRTRARARRMTMPGPSGFSRTAHAFADTVRSLTLSNLTRKERANLRAILVELIWTIERAELEEH